MPLENLRVVLGSELEWDKLMALNTLPVAEGLDLRVAVTWVNLNDETDWTILRFMSSDPIEKLITKLGKVIEKEHFEYVFSVSASKHSLYVTVGSTKPMDEIRDELFQ
jgi:hypothetical protein